MLDFSLADSWRGNGVGRGYLRSFLHGGGLGKCPVEELYSGFLVSREECEITPVRGV